MSEERPAPSTKSDYPSHPAWEDISDEGEFDHHWHHKEVEPYRSIRLAYDGVMGLDGDQLGGYFEGWTIELYPDPKDDGKMTRWRLADDDHEDAELAAYEKVEEIMEEYSEVDVE